MTVVLGVSASLRNARFGRGSVELCEDIAKITDQDGMVAYLAQQTKLRADSFIRAGRQYKLPFDEIYKNLRREKHPLGLSNSEAALVAGLWGAHREGADIRHLGLARHFPADGTVRDKDDLRAAILEADAILLSGPVYFGDRGSLAQEFMEFLREDPEVAAHIRNRVYAGIAVGAKRNGGQETTLIYQLVDATNLNMLGVGNDSETTAQYGGTAVAGDVGTLADDAYGIKTSVGAGSRIARIADKMALGRGTANEPQKTTIGVLLLQDAGDHRGREMVIRACNEIAARSPYADFRLIDCTEDEIYRCIACDVCPIDIGARKDYRCIITSKNDFFRNSHDDLVDIDALLLAAYSPVNRSAVHSVYQRFIERTRYIRRDDYTLGDLIAAPLVISEINSNQNLHIRMMTSLIRHHTVIHHPLIGIEYEGKVLNWDNMIEQGVSFVGNAEKLMRANALRVAKGEESERRYNPVGYVISAEKQRADIETGRQEEVTRARKDEAIVNFDRKRAVNDIS
jgi:multimeric flavodoxin WrbA